MAAVSFETGSFYECKSVVTLSQGDVIDATCPLLLVPGTAVRAVGFVHRSGDKGKGRYVQLRIRTDEGEVTAFHRVSKNGIGKGDWEKMNEMMVLALADVLPLD